MGTKISNSNTNFKILFLQKTDLTNITPFFLQLCKQTFGNYKSSRILKFSSQFKDQNSFTNFGSSFHIRIFKVFNKKRLTSAKTNMWSVNFQNTIPPPLALREGLIILHFRIPGHSNYPWVVSLRGLVGLFFSCNK